MTLQVGVNFGPYEIVAPIGAGGMGEVYKARDKRLDRLVAVKVLAPKFNLDPQGKIRFEREARAVSSLNHPHICTLHDIGQENGVHYLVMEYLEGESLADRLRKGPLPLKEVLQYGAEIAEALSAAHNAGIVHRDLKPGNVMLTKSGAKLLDFGLAKLKTFNTGMETNSDLITISEEEPLTRDGLVIGTAPYMPPERLEGRKTDHRVDIWALGCLLYEMATGKRAFQGESQAGLISAILEKEPQAITALNPSSPRMLDRVVAACVEKDPESRLQSAHDAAQQLAWIREEQTLVPTADMKSRVRERYVWVALFLLMLFAVLWSLYRHPRDATMSPPNPRPVIVLMDSPLPGRVYDPRTESAGGTNADDITDALRDLPVVIEKENTSAIWHREEQVLRSNPDLIVSHLSCLFDARVAESKQPIYDHLFDLAMNRLILFYAYVAISNPRTRFLAYSRGKFGDPAAEKLWVSQTEARFPILRGRLHAFTVPGGIGAATFRDPETARLIRNRIRQILGIQ